MNSIISIIIPVYNVEKLLKRCLNSIANQTYPNLEVILVNDGSTDSSGAICDQYREMDSRFKVIHQNNEGSSSARNKGLKHASGTYIGFVDSDDFIEPAMFENLINHAISDNKHLVTCDYRLSSGQVIANPLGINSVSYKSINIEDHLSTMNTLPNGLFNVWNKLFHKELIQGLEFIYGKIHQDALFVSEVYGRVKDLGLIPLPLYNYYDLNESITRGPFNKKRVEAIDVILQVYDNLISASEKEETHKHIGHWFMVWLLYTYGNLCANPKLDPNSFYRSKIKSLIRKHRPKEKKDVRIVPACSFPFWMYGLTHNLYMKLISIRGAIGKIKG